LGNYATPQQGGGKRSAIDAPCKGLINLLGYGPELPSWSGRSVSWSFRVLRSAV